MSFASGSYRLDKAYVEVSWKILEGGRTAIEIHNSGDVTVYLSDYSEVERVSESLYLIKR